MTSMLPNWTQSPDDPLSAKVVNLVATVTRTDPTDLPPLYETIDTDALDSIFASRPDGPMRATGKLVFRYAGVQVTVQGDGSIDVERPDATE